MDNLATPGGRKSELAHVLMKLKFRLEWALMGLEAVTAIGTAEKSAGGAQYSRGLLYACNQTFNEMGKAASNFYELLDALAASDSNLREEFIRLDLLPAAQENETEFQV